MIIKLHPDTEHMTMLSTLTNEPTVPNIYSGNTNVNILKLLLVYSCNILRCHNF